MQANEIHLIILCVYIYIYTYLAQIIWYIKWRRLTAFYVQSIPIRHPGHSRPGKLTAAIGSALIAFLITVVIFCYRRLVVLTPWGRDKMAAIFQAGDIFKWILRNGNVWISIKIWLKFVTKGPVNNIPALFQIMLGAGQAHICVTRPHRVNLLNKKS